VFLLDDHEIVPRGIADLLETEPGMTVVGEALLTKLGMQRRTQAAVYGVQIHKTYPQPATIRLSAAALVLILLGA
jgi:hypothetical protein